MGQLKKKKKAQPENSELNFIWVQNEDFSQGGNISAISKDTPPKKWGGGQALCDFGEGGP